MNDRRAQRRAFAALVAGAACIGFAPLWVRWSEAGPVATAFYRVALAWPFAAWLAARERPRVVAAPMTPARRRGWLLAAGLLLAADLAAWHGSIRLTSVANATLLANLAPVFVTLGAWWLLRERPGGGFFAGMALALGGAWLLTGASLRLGDRRAAGDALGLLTAVFYGGYQLCVARLRRELGPGRILAWSCAACAPWLLALALATGETVVPGTARGWAVVVGLALTAHVLGQGLITYAFAHLPASHSSLTLLLQPVVAALAGWWLLGERLTAGQAAGGLVVLAGLWLARRDGVREGAGRSRSREPGGA